MSDTRAAMREYRFLNEKRTRGSFSPVEEARWNELRGILGDQGLAESEPVAEDAAPPPQGYYGEDGQWDAYPAGHDAQQPQGYYGEDGQWYAYPAGYDAQQPQGYYGEDGQWYAYPAGYDAQQDPKST